MSAPSPAKGDRLSQPIPRLLLIGVDHRSAPISLREKVSYGSEDGVELLGQLRAETGVREAYLLSTCNRTEIYLQLGEEAGVYARAMGLTFLHKAPEIEPEGRFYVKRDEEAARHLLEVASGLHSMVLGEPEILGQVRQAIALAERAESLGPVLRRLLRAATDTGGRARAETEIERGAVSFGYAVVDLARSIFRQLESRGALLLGAGETAQQVARSLREKGMQRLVVANRTRSRAERFQEQFPGTEILDFESRTQALGRCDLVVATTGAEEAVLTAADLTQAMRTRRPGPLLVVDLGVPRNVETQARQIENLFLHDVDTLETLIDRNLRRRREEIPRVQEILGRELAHFASAAGALGTEPLVAQLQKRAEAIRDRELTASLARLPGEHHAEVERLTRSLVKKILHHPSTQLRRGQADVDGDELARLARRLFQLDNE